MRIARSYQWEMGHRLAFHAGGCANVHGHSYRMRVEIEGTCDEHGMILDFAEMDAFIQPVISGLDHAFMCEKSDAVMRDFLQRNTFKTVLLDDPPTAENIASFLARTFWEHLALISRISALSVRLYETENSSATAVEKRV